MAFFTIKVLVKVTFPKMSLAMGEVIEKCLESENEAKGWQQYLKLVSFLHR